MRTFYGYTGFQRPRPLGPDTRAFALPHPPLVSIEDPPRLSSLLGDLGDKAEREQEKARRAERLKLWGEAIAAVKQIITELMAGNRGWDNIPNVQLSLTPERGPEKKQQKKLDKLLSKDLPRAITYARTMEEISELPSQFTIFDPTSVYEDDDTPPGPILPPPDAPLGPDETPPPGDDSFTLTPYGPYGYGDPSLTFAPQVVTPTPTPTGYQTSPIYLGPTGVTPATGREMVPGEGKEEEGPGATLLSVGGYAAAIAAITGVGLLAWSGIKKLKKARKRRKRR